MVVKRYREADIPLEVIWSDLNWMQANKVFTVETNDYPVDLFRPFLDA